MKANLILKSMLVLLFVCGSAMVTDAGYYDYFRDGHFFVMYKTDKGLIVKNDNGLMHQTVAIRGMPYPVSYTHVYNATVEWLYFLKSGNKEREVIAKELSEAEDVHLY